MQTAKIYVLLLSDSQTHKTLRCLASLQRILQPSFQLLVIERGAIDRSISTIRKNYPKMPILSLSHNLSRGESFNRGITWALSKRAEWIFLLDSNTRVSPDILEKLMAAAQKEAILGAKIYKNENVIEQIGQVWDPKKGRFVFLIDENKVQPVDAVSSSALFMHRSVIETIGLFEPKFFTSWGDSDFCTRAKRRGIEIRTVSQAKVFRQNPSIPCESYLCWKERLLWMKRNRSFEERKKLYRLVIFPELWKHVRRFFFSIAKENLPVL